MAKNYVSKSYYLIDTADKCRCYLILGNEEIELTILLYASKLAVIG